MTHFLASGLSLGTEYEFTVRAINALGESAYQAHAVYARTDAAAPVTDELHDDLPLVVILVVSLFVLLLIAVNVFLIICCIRRRQRKLDKGKLMHEPNWPAANTPIDSSIRQGARPSDSSIRHYGTGCRSGNALRNISPISLPLVTESWHYNTFVTKIASICQFLLE